MIDSYTFRGYWNEADIEKVGYAWEKWHVALFGDEAGDSVDDPEKIKEILRISGYELILRKQTKE